jgi:histidine triad (HIT) family protein
MSCAFCEIARGERSAEIVYADDTAVAFQDTNPQAPTHILVIPREHISGPLDIAKENEHIAGHLVTVAAKVAQQTGIAQDGYRLVINQGRNGGQSVFHMHLHVLGGRRLSWPPG